MSIVEEVGHGSSPWVMDPHGVIHELHPTGFTGLENAVELGHVERDGLFQKQVFLVLGREHGPVKMEAGGEWHVDGVHVGVLQKGLVGAVHFG